MLSSRHKKDGGSEPRKLPAVFQTNPLYKEGLDMSLDNSIAAREGKHRHLHTLASAWDEFIASERVFDSLPTDISDEDIEPFLDANSAVQDRLQAMPICTKADIVVRLKYIFTLATSCRWDTWRDLDKCKDRVCDGELANIVLLDLICDLEKGALS